MSKHTVNSCLIHDGKTYNEGDPVDLTDAQAEHLIKTGVVGEAIEEKGDESPEDPETPEPPKKPNKKAKADK